MNIETQTISPKSNGKTVRIFGARACAAPLEKAAKLFEEQTGIDVEISVCSRHCAQPVAEEATGTTGGVLTWARAFGLFGPLLILVGSVRGRTEVLSTTIYKEQSIGNLEVALAVALLMIVVAGAMV